LGGLARGEAVLGLEEGGQAVEHFPIWVILGDPIEYASKRSPSLLK